MCLEAIFRFRSPDGIAGTTAGVGATGGVTETGAGVNSVRAVVLSD